VIGKARALPRINTDERGSEKTKSKIPQPGAAVPHEFGECYTSFVKVERRFAEINGKPLPP
jgi:hypothetical protein